MPGHRVFAMKFARVYPLYVQKAERKKRTKDEVDQIIRWLTGYNQAQLQQQIDRESDLETFFAQAPAMHPNRALIKGVVCGVRVEEIADPLMQKIRYLDQLIDELANFISRHVSRCERAPMPTTTSPPTRARKLTERDRLV